MNSDILKEEVLNILAGECLMGSFEHNGKVRYMCEENMQCDDCPAKVKCDHYTDFREEEVDEVQGSVPVWEEEDVQEIKEKYPEAFL